MSRVMDTLLDLGNLKLGRRQCCHQGLEQHLRRPCLSSPSIKPKHQALAALP